MDQLQHFSHDDHPLILIDQAKDGDSSSVVCDGCWKAVSGEAYKCRQCYFILHKSCAQLPSKIIHSSHPQHSLTLLSKSPYEGLADCSNCGRTISGFIYNCSICEYDLDMECVLQGQIVNHEGHEHSYMPIRSTSFTCGACEKTGDGICYMCSTCQLVIHIDCASHPTTDSSFHTFNLLSMFPTIEKSSTSNLQNTMLDRVLDLDPLSENYLTKIKLQHICHRRHLLQYGDAKDKKDLYGIDCMKCTLCREEIRDGPIYSCDECGCHIHKVCSELPKSIRNAFHPMHLLDLHYRSRYAVGLSTRCSLCRIDKQTRSGYEYRCSSTKCDFYLHPQCASENTFDPKNHKHTFTNIKTTKFTCDGCGIENNFRSEECASCICLICQLQVHVKCKNSFPLSLTQRLHHHELKLRYSFEIDFKFADKFCKICSKKMNSVLCMYQCNNDACAYLAHIACATEEYLVVQNIDGHNTLVEPNKIDEQAITHFNHHHPLMIISNDEPKIDEPPKICYGCVRPISVPFYTCDSDECSFFLHQQCFDLPKTIQHPLHYHPLVLKDFPDLGVDDILNGFKCLGCYGRCNGFAYACLECSYILDVGCGLFSTALKHESHNCKLGLISLDEVAGEHKMCKACESNSYDGFWCEECDFYLDLKCASLPGSVGHECPTGTIWYVKPIKLRYDCIEHVHGQYYCDLCEETREKDQWFYHCEDCHDSIHPKCLLGKGRIKYGDSYYNFPKVHPHAVCVVKKPRTDPLCNTCGMPCKDSPLVFCPTCDIYFHAHYACFDYLAEHESKPLIRDYFAAARKLDL